MAQLNKNPQYTAVSKNSNVFSSLLDCQNVLQDWQKCNATYLTPYSYKRLWHDCCPSSVRRRCIVAKRCEIVHKLLLITNRKSHTPFDVTWKSSTLDDLERQNYNRNCTACSMSSLATAVLSCFTCSYERTSLNGLRQTNYR